MMGYQPIGGGGGGENDGLLGKHVCVLSQLSTQHILRNIFNGK